MANLPRTRKRVLAIRRAPDGSAFRKCGFCGVSVAIALADMHECKSKRGFKRFKGEDGNPFIEKPIFLNQPRSPFCLFMESFRKIHKNEEDQIDIDRNGFNTWKIMSIKERHHYFFEASKVNFAYEEALRKEVDDSSVVDDEADSAMVGKFDKDYEDYMDCESSEGYESDFWLL